MLIVLLIILYARLSTWFAINSAVYSFACSPAYSLQHRLQPVTCAKRERLFDAEIDLEPASMAEYTINDIVSVVQSWKIDETPGRNDELLAEICYT
jgi:hypothetical protein